jgi:divalent metal cation (Fe/Co/Zn/Cd) transporter
MSTEGVERIDVLRTRKYANKIFVDVEIAVRADLSLLESHKIAERVHERVEHEIGEEIKHCMVHVNPLGGNDNHESPQKEMEENE